MFYHITPVCIVRQWDFAICYGWKGQNLHLCMLSWWYLYHDALSSGRLSLWSAEENDCPRRQARWTHNLSLVHMHFIAMWLSCPIETKVSISKLKIWCHLYWNSMYSCSEKKAWKLILVPRNLTAELNYADAVPVWDIFRVIVLTLFVVVFSYCLMNYLFASELLDTSVKMELDSSADMKPDISQLAISVGHLTPHSTVQPMPMLHGPHMHASQAPSQLSLQHLSEQSPPGYFSAMILQNTPPLAPHSSDQPGLSAGGASLQAGSHTTSASLNMVSPSDLISPNGNLTSPQVRNFCGPGTSNSGQASLHSPGQCKP